MDFETERTDRAVCPHCGYEDPDSWEIGDGEGDTETCCNSCGEDYLSSRHVSISYSTRKIKRAADERRKDHERHLRANDSGAGRN